jgi:hypothetical protein
MSKLSNKGSKQFDEGDFIESTQDETFNSVTNVIDAINRIEFGQYHSLEELASLYQVLIDEGIVWHLQGGHQRQASHLIATGYCHQDSASS